MERAIRFGRYVLHPTQGLTRGRQEIRVTAKSLAVLHALACRPGTVVTKDELFAEVWPDTAVSDAALTSCIKELRHALNDDARRPRYIETLHRRGYRFVAPPAAAAADAPLPAPVDRLFVGRAGVLDELRLALARACAGSREVVFVTGEAGIGKTALVEHFIAQATSAGGVRAAVGQCVEYHGRGEAYQPLLDAMGALGRSGAATDVGAALGRYAPTWLAQLPSLAPRASSAVPPPITTPERMVRELVDAMDALTASVPLILCLEDLHWTDASTLDWIAAAAHRREKARLLIIATSRPDEKPGREHAVGALADALRVKGLCREIALPGLDAEAVTEYVSVRFPAPDDGQTDLVRLALMVHAHTQGNPLFAVHVLSDLQARGCLVEGENGWRVDAEVRPETLGVPEDLRRVIERDIERLGGLERELLDAASVSGMMFSAASVAAATGTALAAVETVLAGLSRQKQFVRQAGAAEWPDRTVAARFEFIHALHRDVLYDRQPAGQRTALHRAIGIAEEAAFGSEARTIAAQLAAHFERGHDEGRAIIYLQQAAETARRRSAFREAQMYYGKALSLVERQPAGPARDEREATLRIGLGSVLQVTQGWGASEAEDEFARARSLCQAIGDTPRLFPALFGLWLFYWGHGSLAAAGELADQLHALARQTDDAALRLQAHHARWATLFSRGDLHGALMHATQGMALYDVSRHAGMAATYGNHDAGACGRSFSARALMMMGRPDEAVRASEEAVAEARALGHPVTLCLALIFAAGVHQLRRNADATADCADAAAAVAREHGMSLLLGWSSVLGGWAEAQRGRPEQGLARIREGVAHVRNIGSEQFLSHLAALMADACRVCGNHDAALDAVALGLESVGRTGERFYEAELLRLKGEALLARSRDETTCGEAELAFRAAQQIARRQGAALLELRVVVSLARLQISQGKDLEAREGLSAACAQIAGGAALPDVIDAQDVLRKAARR